MLQIRDNQLLNPEVQAYATLNSIKEMEQTLGAFYTRWFALSQGPKGPISPVHRAQNAARQAVSRVNAFNAIVTVLTATSATS